MLPANLRLLFRNVSCVKNIHTSAFKFKDYENPLWRTFNVLRNDFKFEKKTSDDTNLMGIFPNHVDIVIIGGGAMGSSIAYWLKEKSGLNGVKVAVIEKDPTYAKSMAVLSAGGLSQQYSLPENIHMSLFGAEFIRTLKKRFQNEWDVYYTPNGYLMLADEISASQVLDNARLQKDLGAVNVILSASELKERFPWMNVDDIELGCLGLEKVGWFDPWALLCSLKAGAMKAGAQYITAELEEFLFTEKRDIIVSDSDNEMYEGINEVIVKLPNGERKSIQFAICILACGAESGEVAKLARIGTGPGLLSIPLPVEKRKKNIYCFECPNEGPGLNTPMVIDYNCTYFRRDGLGGTFIGGLSPIPNEKPQPIDYTEEQYFNEKILPNLSYRVPSFNNVKIRHAWSGFYDYNHFDENGIIGPHPYYYNMYIAAGFCGNGIQLAPAAGRAIAELILDGDFDTIGLSRLGFDRFVVNKPMYEICIV